MTAPAKGAKDVDSARLPDTRSGRAEFVRDRVALARRVRAEGDAPAAAAVIAAALRAGLWEHGQLWSELSFHFTSPDDYTALRTLWSESPESCHRTLPVLRAVARGASIAGAHEEARALLRQAIQLQARRRRRLRARLGRMKRRLVAAVPRRGTASATFEQRATVALTDLQEELQKLSVRAFLISGTLLGYLREGGFISWDKDIDLGFLTEDGPPHALEHAFARSPRFQARRLDFNTDRMRVNHLNGIMVDLFPHYPDGSDRVWHDGSATRWWNTPFALATVEFLGREQLVPADPERYLRENYGDDWRLPDPDFDARLDAPNVEVTDQDFFDTLLYFSLLDAIAKGNTTRRIRYASLLRDLGEGEWLDRLAEGKVVA